MTKGRLFFIASLVFFSGVVSYRVYDRQGSLVEIWEDRGRTIDIYGPDMSRKGHVRKEPRKWTRYDKESRMESTVKRNDGQEIALDRIAE